MIKIWKTKSAEDVSLKMFLALCTGAALWLVYGFIKKDMAIQVTNGLTLLKELNLAVRHAQNCELMLVLGSSLTVNPAASLVGLALQAKARVVLINRGETPYDDVVTLRITTGIANILPPVVTKAKQLFSIKPD